MDIRYFESQEALDNYLSKHHNESGFWIRFSKKNEPKLTYDEAVVIALKHGWIDGQVKRIDDDYFIRYFTQRRAKSVWSTKNKNTVVKLIENNQMTKAGLDAVEIAKTNGCWDKADLPPDDFSMIDFKSRVAESRVALDHFESMSASVQRTYAMSYYTLKTAVSRQRRLQVILERLEKKMKPLDR